MPVDTIHRDYWTRLPQWSRCRDFIEGEDCVKDRGTLYLPQLSGQETAEYTAYKTRASFFNGSGRAADGLHGLVFRKDPIIELPEGIAFMQRDATMTGTPLIDFADQVFRELLEVGRVGVLVDYPPGLTDVPSMADAEAMGRRPYMTYYCAENIINWRWIAMGGACKLDMVVLRDFVDSPVDDDMFDIETAVQYRVLELVDGTYTISVWRSDGRVSLPARQAGPDASRGRENLNSLSSYATINRIMEQNVGGELEQVERIVPTVGGMPLNYIPFRFIQASKDARQVAKPPLLDLVNVNCAHYRNSADYEHGVHFTGIPTPVIISSDVDSKEEVHLGAERALLLRDGTAMFLEFRGEGLTQAKDAMREKEMKMGTLGLRMLLPDRVQSETAETARIYRIGEHSVLASMARNASLGIRQGLEWIAQWQGVDTEDMEFMLNLDYFPTELSPQSLLELGRAANAGVISTWDLFDALKAGEIVRHDKTYAAWKDELDVDRDERMARLPEPGGLQNGDNTSKSGDNMPSMPDMI